MTDTPRQSIYTRLSHKGRAGTHAHGFVNPPIHRGSTVLVETMQQRRDIAAKRGAGEQRVLTYGIAGSETHWALEDVVADIEGGTRCQIVSTGLAACTVPMLAYLGSGDHVLIPDSVYGPVRNFADTMLKRMGVTTTYYDPCIDPAGIGPLFRDNTKVLYTESPGSHTFEIQDVPGLAALAHAKGAKVLMDNTWGIHHFQPFTKGVDVSMQALTKYVGGHSDVMLGSITVNSAEDWAAIRAASGQLGMFASPDDVWLALRGVRTMAVRMERQEKSALEVATWMRGRPEVKEVLHPALPGARGHDIWKRDFTGACSLFGVVFQPGFAPEKIDAVAEALQLFGMGASWGGFESLALPSGTMPRTAGSGDFGGPMMRLHVGLEHAPDLIADLDQAMRRLHANVA